jgi:hypothetical protein
MSEMSTEPQPVKPDAETADQIADDDAEIVDGLPVEVVDGLPVLAEVRVVEPAPAGAIPTIHAAAMAAGGFVAGAAAMALVRRYGSRKLADAALPRFPSTGPARTPAPSSPGAAWPVGTSRTYLVNVRLIARSGE